VSNEGVDMAASKAAANGTAQDEAVQEAPQPGEGCPCCGRKVPANSKGQMTPEEKRAKQAEYNSRPDVKEARKAYNAKRNAELKMLRELQRELAAAEVPEDESEPGDEA